MFTFRIHSQSDLIFKFISFGSRCLFHLFSSSLTFLIINTNQVANKTQFAKLVGPMFCTYYTCIVDLAQVYWLQLSSDHKYWWLSSYEMSHLADRVRQASNHWMHAYFATVPCTGTRFMVITGVRKLPEVTSHLISKLDIPGVQKKSWL